MTLQKIYEQCTTCHKKTTKEWTCTKVDGGWVHTEECTACHKSVSRHIDHPHQIGQENLYYTVQTHGHADGLEYDYLEGYCSEEDCETLLVSEIIGETITCPNCGDNGVAGWVVDAESGELLKWLCETCDYEKPATDDDDGDDDDDNTPKPPVNPDNPTDPDNPEDPTDPDNPDDPDNPNDPTDPDTPDNPDDPDDPNNPDNPTDPTDPDNPDNPDEGGDDDEGLTTETPPNNTPVTTVTSITQAAVGLPDSFGEPPWHIILSRYDYNKEKWYVFKERWVALDYKTEVFFFGLSFFNEIAKEEYPIKLCYIFNTEYDRTYSNILLFEQPPIII